METITTLIFFSQLALILILLITLVRWHLRILNGEKKLGKQQRSLNAANQLIADQNLEIIALKNDLLSLQRSLYNTDPVVYKIRTFSARKAKAILTEQEWHAYLSLLEDIFHFISRLKNTYPSLTDNDVRLCALLKESVPLYHIADILGEDEEKLHSRLKKIGKEKMELQGTKTLADYMKTF